MGMKFIWLLKGLFALLDFRKLGVFQEIYKLTRFDAAISPSWSQNGEDIAIEALVQRSGATKFYLDIGAHDPNRFSVTRKLYQDGWVGIDVDGNPNYEKKFKKLRPKNEFLNVCVGQKDQYEFTIFSEGAISSANPEWVRRFLDEGNLIESNITVPGRTLRQILDSPQVPKRVGFINIDIEGADEDALKSIDFASLELSRYPSWILLETSPPVSQALDSPAVKYAIEFGYRPWAVLPMATLLKSPH